MCSARIHVIDAKFGLAEMTEQVVGAYKVAPANKDSKRRFVPHVRANTAQKLA
jgi:hypothetical protein